MSKEQKIQLDKILLNRTNIKRLSRPVAQTEKGALELCLDADGEDYYLRLGGVKIDGLDEVVENLVEQL